MNHFVKRHFVVVYLALACAVVALAVIFLLFTEIAAVAVGTGIAIAGCYAQMFSMAADITPFSVGGPMVLSAATYTPSVVIIANCALYPGRTELPIAVIGTVFMAVSVVCLLVAIYNRMKLTVKGADAA